MRTAAARILLSTLLAAWCLAVPAAPASAEDPVRLSRDGQITDRVGALGNRTNDVEAALDRLYDTRRVQLFVVYVRDFSGRPGQSWADATAGQNGLGSDDVLLAVATHDRQYAYSVDQGSRLTDAQLDDVARTAIEPALRGNDWAGAAVGAANGYAAVLAGQPVPVPTLTPGEADPGGGAGDGVSGAGDLVLPVVVVGAAVRWPRTGVHPAQEAHEHPDHARPGGPGAPGAGGPAARTRLQGQAGARRGGRRDPHQ